MGSDLKVDNNSEEPSCYFPTRQEPNIKLNVKVTKNGLGVHSCVILVSQPRRELNVAVPLLKVGQVLMCNKTELLCSLLHRHPSCSSCHPW